MSRRHLATLLLAFAAALGALGTPVGPTAPIPVRAATPDLTIVTAARYDVQPAQRRVRVTVDMTMHNRLKDTKTKRFFFDYAVLDVIPQATGFRVTTDGSGSPSVRVTRSTALQRQLGLVPRLVADRVAATAHPRHPGLTALQRRLPGPDT